MTPNIVQLQLRIFEGTNFHLLDSESSLKFTGSLDGVKLSTNLMPLKSISNLRLEIGEEMIWKMSHRNFERLKKTKALKLECASVSPRGAISNIGYIILCLKSVTNSTKSSKDWRTLLGTSFTTNNCPQLLVSLYTKTDEDTNQKVAATPNELVTDRLVPQLVVKNGLTYIGPERFCLKHFQVTFVLQRALNLHLLIPARTNTSGKKTHLQMTFLGQPLCSSAFKSLEPQICFDQTFVFDVMSSEDMLKQYLKDHTFVELELKTGDDCLVGRCKQFTDTLTLDESPNIQLICFMSGTSNSDVRSSQSEVYSTVEIAVSIQRLEKSTMDRTLNSEKKSDKVAEYEPKEIVDTGLTLVNNLEQECSENVELTSDRQVNLHHKDIENVETVSDPKVINKLVEAIVETQQARDKLLDTNDDCIFTEKELIKDSIFDLNDETENPQNEIIIAEDQFRNDCGNHNSHLHRGEEVANLSLRRPDDHVFDDVFTPPLNSPLSNTYRLDLKEPHESRHQRPGAISPSVYNSEILTKIVEELEEWKFREKILFSEELKQQKEAVSRRWEAELKARCERFEEEKEVELAQTKALSKQLEQKLKILQQQSQEFISEETKFKELYSTVHKEYSSKKRKFQEKLEEAKARINSQSHQIQQLRRQLELAQNANSRETRKMQGSETAQLAELKEKVRQLEKQLLDSQREKATYVRKWVEAQRAIENIKVSASSNIKKQHREKIIRSSLEEEQLHMQSERSDLEHLRQELEKFGLGMAAACANNSDDPHPSDGDTPISQLRRLEEEKNTLLRSGAYGPDSEIIRDIVRAMDNGSTTQHS